MVIADSPDEPVPVGVIVTVPVYVLFGVIVKLVEALFALPLVGPVKVKVVAPNVTVTLALAEVDILPAASLAQAYRVFEPDDENVYEVGAEADQPLYPVDGVVADSFTRYPVTPVASVAVRELIDTVSDDAVAGTVKAVMVGAVESEGAAGVTALEADEATE